MNVCLVIFFGGVLNINILFVSVDRFIVIKWLFMYNSWVIMKLFVCLILISWFFLVVFVILFLVGWGGFEGLIFMMCRFILILSREYFVICYIFIYGVLLVIIIIFYFYILKVVFRYLCVIVV